ncbi:uncharacterized protein CMC5_001900 [Chondromyces crocatus]|uniref:Uncharacterized protein n=1 Tax=Chondromyces crocatus TaxID=52 RepID=A0A0K1E5Y1_CHOCO|nr:uncharacterized protein CMC5_001900 [Chondromyces crocatus]
MQLQARRAFSTAGTAGAMIRGSGQNGVSIRCDITVSARPHADRSGLRAEDTVV